MKILWVGDAVVSSGFARCTHVVCRRLHADGHDVRVLGLNYFGDPHPYPYVIYPCRNPLAHGHDSFGNTRLPYLIHEFEPDVVVILNDPWNVPNYIAHIKATLADDFPLPLLVGWLAVDGANQQGYGCNDLDLVVTWTEYAQRELRRGGYNGPLAQATLGVDLESFYPRPRLESRSFLGPLAEKVGESLLLGAVGRNQIRKRLDLTIQYFSDLIHGYDVDAYLYLHVGPTGDTGYDLKSLNRYYGVQDRVIIGTAALGQGAEERIMPLIYSMLDIYVTTTQGEGFGLPCLEAMACGVPCVVPEWSALAEWPGDAVTSILCSSTAMTAPTNGKLHTIGGIADRARFVDALFELCSNPDLRDVRGGLARARAEQFPWSNAAGQFADALYSLVSLPVRQRVVGDLGSRSGDSPETVDESTTKVMSCG